MISIKSSVYVYYIYDTDHSSVVLLPSVQIPILGQSILWGQHILVDRRSREQRTGVLEDCIDRLKRGISICLFPEGTRSSLKDAEMLVRLPFFSLHSFSYFILFISHSYYDGQRTTQPFQKGAFLIAQQAGVRIIPLSLSHTGEVAFEMPVVFPMTIMIVLASSHSMHPVYFSLVPFH